MSPRLQFAVEAAYVAGRSTLGLFNTRPDVEIKSDATPLTLADRNAERILREMIGKAYPNDAILGEEEGATGSSDDQWIIDPIDGTKSFICGVPLYGTLLSFERGGETLIGIAYMPALDWMVYAEKGQGTFSNGRKASVSNRADIEGSIICCGGHKHMRLRKKAEAIDRIAEKAMATRTWMDVYGYCLVASGQVDAMIDPAVAYWDLSAVSLIIEEAGGLFTNHKGGPWRDGHEEGTYESCGANPVLHPKLIAELQRSTN